MTVVGKGIMINIYKKVLILSNTRRTRAAVLFCIQRVPFLFCHCFFSLFNSFTYTLFLTSLFNNIYNLLIIFTCCQRQCIHCCARSFSLLSCPIGSPSLFYSFLFQSLLFAVCLLCQVAIMVCGNRVIGTDSSLRQLSCVFC